MYSSPKSLSEAAEALIRLHQLSIKTPDERPELIRKARAGRVAWEDIAEVAGVSRSTAINLSKVGSDE